MEENGHGIFTTLMLEALYGAGANILGYVTPGSLYSFVDQALGEWSNDLYLKLMFLGLSS
ncbi:hypothetical protein [Enterobacter cloacae complex sp. 356H4]|uniref:hypothetical protein n=1 Tax=Enterobacter cloacae complex sp. 356H4 TaxID=3395836 RepID=UPI003CF4FF1F